MNTCRLPIASLGNVLLCLLLAGALIVGLVPASASAEVEGTEQQDSAAETANSWRYENGVPLDPDEVVCDGSSSDDDSGSSTSLSLMASSSYPHSTWKKSYGTSYLGIAKSGGKTTKVAISGVERVGIDVSKWQEDIDWDKVAAAGIDYAIIRCGYGKNKTAYDDAYFAANVKGALAAGIEIGVYLYSYATSTSGAKSEANHALRLLKKAGLEPGDLDLPVFLDMEDSTQASLSASKLGAIATKFCDTVEDEGYVVGIYANTTWWNEYLTASVFQSRGWVRWVARYPTSTGVKSTDVDDTSIWQFTSQGTVPGISGDCDVNFDFCGEGSYANLEAHSVGYDSVKVSWSKVSSAVGYEVQCKRNGGNYKTVKTVTSTSCKVTGLVCGKKYRFRIRALYEEDDVDTGEATTVYGTWLRTLWVRPVPAKVSISSLGRASSASAIKVNWKKVSGASGYEVWRSKAGGSYKKVRTIKGVSNKSWKNTALSVGKAYSYKVRAYRVVDGIKVYGTFSNAAKLTVKPAKVVISKVTSNKKRSGTVKWDKIGAASGYQVAYRMKGSKTWHYVKAKATRRTLSDLRSKKKYYVKVRAYKKANGKLWYGAWSSSKLLKVS